MQRLRKMSLYRNRYRVETTRLQDRDYTEAGLYFVTICVKDGRCVFGNIRDSEVLLSPLGVIAFRCWQEIPRHHAGVELDSFVVMPNHLHGIVKLPGSSWTLEGDRRAIAGIAPPPKKNSLGTVIRSCKSAVSRQARLAGRADFAWQERYYDHVIRKPGALPSIRDYILQNPANWLFDSNNPDVAGFYAAWRAAMLS